MKLHDATPSAAPPRQQACRSFVRALNRGDAGAAVACFTADGCLVTPDATAIHGRERIRPVIAQLIARRTEIEVELSSTLGAGDVALVHERWRVSSAGVGGARFEQRLAPTLALRRAGGDWKLAIAALWR